MESSPYVVTASLTLTCSIRALILRLAPQMVTFGSVFAIQAKSLTLRLHWVQGHLDKVAPVQHFPEIHVALNFAADVMADSIAARIQHPMHVSSGVLFQFRLVKRIQLRLCRILISHLEKVAYDKKIKIPLAPRNRIQDALDMSPHCLVPFANG